MNFAFLLPLALIALCPIMMFVMMRGNRDSHNQKEHTKDNHHS